MKRYLIILALSTLAWGQTPPTLMDDFPPVQSANCSPMTTYCNTQIYGAPHVAGFVWQVQWGTVETAMGTYSWDSSMQKIQVYSGLTVGATGAVRSGCPGTCSTTVTYTTPYGSTAPIAVGAKVLPLAMTDTSFNATVGTPYTVTASTATTVTYVDGGSANATSGNGTIEVACVNGQRCLFTPILVHISNGTSNAATPAYVGTQAGADGEVAGVSYVNAHLYYNSDQVFYSGSYYQVSTSGSCTSNGANPTVDAGCTWTNLGAHAAPQDFGFCTSFPGTNNGGTLPTNAVANLNTVGIVQATLLTGLTAMWETPAKQAWANLAGSMMTYLAAQPWNSRILETRLGQMKGGEAFLQCGNIFYGAMTPNTLAQLKAVFNSYAAYTYSTQIALRNSAGLSFAMEGALDGGDNPYQTCDWPDINANAMAAVGMAIGNQGLSTADSNGQTCVRVANSTRCRWGLGQ